MQGDESIPWMSVVEFLSSRLALLDGVVFSGGEPTLQSALLDAVAEVRELGFRIGLHTAGMMPERFASLLPSLDWVGFDVKAPFSMYSRITGVEGSGNKALESLRSLLASGIPFEIRTTVHPLLLSQVDLIELRGQLLNLGVENFVVQRFRPQGVRPGLLPAVVGEIEPQQHYGRAFPRFKIR